VPVGSELNERLGDWRESKCVPQWVELKNKPYRSGARNEAWWDELFRVSANGHALCAKTGVLETKSCCGGTEPPLTRRWDEVMKSSRIENPE